MLKRTAKRSPRGNSVAVTLPKDMVDAAGLRPGDERSLLVGCDGIIEIGYAAPADAALDATEADATRVMLDVAASLRDETALERWIVAPCRQPGGG